MAFREYASQPASVSLAPRDEKMVRKGKSETETCDEEQITAMNVSTVPKQCAPSCDRIVNPTSLLKCSPRNHRKETERIGFLFVAGKSMVAMQGVKRQD